jgi:outer membrane protein OmpA-like peptidoglycan-associated protein
MARAKLRAVRASWRIERASLLARRARVAVGAVVAMVVLAVPTVSSAQTRTGFAVDRFEPAEHGSRQFVGDPLDLRPGTAAAGATLDYAYKPLVLYDASGAERYALVRHQTLVHLGGAIVVASRLRLALDVPVALYQDGESAIVSGERLSAASAPAFGDVRLAADVRVIGEHGQPFTLAAGVRGWLPTGLRSQFTSDGSARIAPQVLAAGALGPFVWSARVALVYRSRTDDYAGRALGSEVFAAAGAGLRTRDERLVVGPELYAASAFTGGAKFLGLHETPVEWLFGAHYDVVSNVRIGAGIGSGLGRGYGAPLVRGLASIEWVTAPPPPPPAKDEDREEHTPWEGFGTGNGGNGQTAPRPPLAVVTENEIHIEEEIGFAVDSADLAGPSDPVLSAVKRILDEHPELRRVRIEGHTDSTGDPAYNDDLSARRALSVMSWLTSHGIDPARLESVGRGSREPLDTNESEQGRAKNRRVVFKILEREGASP